MSSLTTRRRPDGTIAPAAPPVAGRRPGRPLLAAAITIYASLLVVGLAIPQSVVGALRDLPPGPWLDPVLRAAERIESELGRTGLPALFANAREAFHQATCGPPDSANPC